MGAGTLASSLAARLRDAIVKGEFEPGERLRLDLLREHYGVSLSPLREALSRLGSEGFLLIEDQRGYRVPPVSEDDLNNITQLRCHLETHALREAIRKGSLTWESEVTAALHILNRIDRNTSEEIPVWEKAHRDFHLKLISACDVPLLLQFCATVHDHSDRYRRLFLKHRSGDQRVPLQHKRIAEAAITRNADLACELLREHIERAAANAREGIRLTFTAERREPGK